MEHVQNFSEYVSDPIMPRESFTSAPKKYLNIPNLKLGKENINVRVGSLLYGAAELPFWELVFPTSHSLLKLWWMYRAPCTVCYPHQQIHNTQYIHIHIYIYELHFLYRKQCYMFRHICIIFRQSYPSALLKLQKPFRLLNY